MNRLAVELGDLRLKNPVVVAAAPPTETVDNVIRCANAGAGAVITKSIADYDESAYQLGARRAYLDHQGLWATSTYRRETLSLEAGIKLVAESVDRSGIPIIASVTAQDTRIESWLDTCLALEQAGASMIQLDLFYLPQPVYSPSRVGAARNLIDGLCSELSIPVMPKLNIEIPAHLAADLLSGSKIAALSYLDSVRVSPPIDIYAEGRLTFRFVNKPSGSSLFGSWQKPLTLHYTHVLSQLVELPLCAGGGLKSGDDAVEMIMLGATAVQFASVVVLHGFNRITNILSDMERFLEEGGYQDIDALRGIAWRGIGSPDETTFDNVQAEVDPALCNTCGRCLELVFCGAISQDRDRVHISSERCDGCNLCTFVCETNAITLRKKQMNDHV